MKYKLVLKKILILGGLVSLFNSCSMKRVENELYSVVGKVNLPQDLKEISGLTYYEQGSFLAVQDELGIIFVLDEKTGDINNEFKFGKKGDYEGLTLVGNTVFILRSDGDLYSYNLETGKSSKHKNPYAKNSEFEGLCYDQVTKRLILSCKSSNKSKLNKYMLFYGFNLDDNTWEEEPIYTVSKKEVELLAGFDIGSLKASGIVKHPVTQGYFIVASIGSLLIEVDASFNLKRIIPLHDNFNQPEGITINSNGDLIISNEAGQGKEATLYTLVLK